jgi:hypothetical protein
MLPTAIPSTQTLVIHAETGVVCGTFPDQQSAYNWIDGLCVNPTYKARCYRTVNAFEYWKREGYAVTVTL